MIYADHFLPGGIRNDTSPAHLLDLAGDQLGRRGTAVAERVLGGAGVYILLDDGCEVYVYTGRVLHVSVTRVCGRPNP